MPITLPTPPNTGDPDTFNPRANAFFGAMPAFAAEMNALAASFGPGSPYCTVTSGINGIALSSGLSLPGPVEGQRVLFKPDDGNTGPVTIKLDGTGYISARTLNGDPLPANYLRPGRLTAAAFDGTYWRVGRDTGFGENSNGKWWRYEDGRQDWTSEPITAARTTANGVLWRSAAQVITFAVPFAYPPTVWPGQVSEPADTWVSCNALSTTQAEVFFLGTSSQSSRTARIHASGRWY